MSNPQHLVRQWLETDAAFGVTEVPLGQGRRNPAAKTAPPETPARVPAPQTVAAAPPPRPQAAAPVRPPAPKPATAPATSPPNVHFAVRRKTAPLPPTPAGNIADLPPLTRKQKEAAMAALHAEIETASRPIFSDICTRVVFGEGDPDAALMFVGEGPGAEEDKTGRPFVGRSGQLLDKMIAAIGYKREDVYIGNVVKLRCAEWTADGGRLQDRPPNPDEVARGLPLLHRQIEIIRPRVIVTLGAPAVKYLTGTTEGVMKIRGTWLNYRGIPVMPTYHPSFVLRAYTPENRGKVWADLKEAMKRIKGS